MKGLYTHTHAKFTNIYSSCRSCLVQGQQLLSNFHHWGKTLEFPWFARHHRVKQYDYGLTHWTLQACIEQNLLRYKFCNLYWKILSTRWQAQCHQGSKSCQLMRYTVQNVPMPIMKPWVWMNTIILLKHANKNIHAISATTYLHNWKIARIHAHNGYD